MYMGSTDCSKQKVCVSQALSPPSPTFTPTLSPTFKPTPSPTFKPTPKPTIMVTSDKKGKRRVKRGKNKKKKRRKKKKGKKKKEERKNAQKGVMETNFIFYEVKVQFVNLQPIS